MGRKKPIIDYNILINEGLRTVVKQALLIAEKEQQIPGEHAFLITFNTTYPGVEISTSLLEKYPQAMTIVLQHQFESLQVFHDYFKITLYFNGIREELRIPFLAVYLFQDPSTEFALQFTQVKPKKTPKAKPSKNHDEKVVSLDAYRKKREEL